MNGHNLRLVSLVNSKEVYTVPFEGEPPQFDSRKIIYFGPSENEATAKQCDLLGINFKEMMDNSAGVLIGPKYQFLAELKKAIPVKGQYTCYAVQ